MKYKSAVVGCGRIGFGFDKDPKRKYIATHIGAYSFAKDVELVAICDIDKRKLDECKKKWNVRGGYTNVNDMLEKEKIDILSICTPPHTHYHILKEAVNFPIKAIFCEKPLADNLKSAKKIISLCDRKKIILQVNHQRRFDPLHIHLRELIKNKTMGEVQQINFYYTSGIKNTGSHMFDLLIFFFGDIEWIVSLYSKNKSHQKDDPNLDGIVKFKNKQIATFQALDVKKYLIFEMNCFFENGKFTLKNSGFSLELYEVGDSRYFSGYSELYKTKPPFKIKYKRNFMINAISHLVECINNNKDSISSGKDGLKSLEAIESSIISAKNNNKKIFLE